MSSQHPDPLADASPLGEDPPETPVDDAPAAEAAPDEAPAKRTGGRPIRSEHHDAMLDLKALANRLAAMPEGQRRLLPLDEETQEALQMLKDAERRPSRRRLLMRARLLLGTADPEKLQQTLTGNTPAAARDRECIRWRTRILAGGDDDLQAFMERWPRADRQAIRANAREARGTSPAAARAQTRLLALIREAAALAAEAPPED